MPSPTKQLGRGKRALAHTRSLPGLALGLVLVCLGVTGGHRTEAAIIATHAAGCPMHCLGRGEEHSVPEQVDDEIAHASTGAPPPEDEGRQLILLAHQSTDGMTAADLEALITYFESFPTVFLHSQHRLITHLHLILEAKWRPLLEGLDPTAAGTEMRNLGDAAAVVQALYLRSLPPPKFADSWSSGALSIQTVRHPRARALMLTLYASELLQVDFGRAFHPKNDPAAVVDMRPRARDLLREATLASPDSFLPHLSLSALTKHSLLLELDVPNALANLGNRDWVLQKSQPDVLNRLREEQRRLSEAIERSLGRDVRMRGPGQTEEALCFDEAEIAGLSPAELRLYLSYINNWLDMDMIRVVFSIKRELFNATSGVIGDAVSARHTALRSLATAADRYEQLADDPGYVHAQLLGSLVTLLESTYCAQLVWPEHPLPAEVSSFKEQWSRLKLALAEDELVGWPDWYEITLIVNHLRNQSPYLRHHWTPDQLAAELRTIPW